jgi:hypothetical protein
MRKWIERFRRARALNFWAERECRVMPLSDYLTLRMNADAAGELIARSGFLRNGAEHSAKCRHAERKLSRFISRAIQFTEVTH